MSENNLILIVNVHFAGQIVVLGRYRSGQYHNRYKDIFVYRSNEPITDANPGIQCGDEIKYEADKRTNYFLLKGVFRHR